MMKPRRQSLPDFLQSPISTTSNNNKRRSRKQQRVTDFVLAKHLQHVHEQSDPAFYTEPVPAVPGAVNRPHAVAQVSWNRDETHGDCCSEITLKDLHFDEFGDDDDVSLDFQRLASSSRSSRSSARSEQQQRQQQQQAPSTEGVKEQPKRPTEHSGSTFPMDQSGFLSLEEHYRVDRLQHSIDALSLQQPMPQPQPTTARSSNKNNDSSNKKHSFLETLSNSWPSLDHDQPRKQQGQTNNKCQRVQSVVAQQHQEQRHRDSTAAAIVVEQVVV